MPEEMNIGVSEEGGLSTGTQIGIAAFFVGLPFLGMGIEALGWGETGLVLAALGAGSIGLGTKALIDRTRQRDEQGGERQALPVPRLTALDRLQHANWRALLRPIDEAEGDRNEEASAPARNQEQGLHDHLNLGPQLRPHADTFLSGRKVLLGTSGSGKSNSLRTFLEEIGRLKMPIILFDTEDEYRDLYRYLPHPQWLEKSRLLTPENAYATAQTILCERYQCIINLQSYEDEEAAWIMIRMIQGVRDWEESQTVRIPCELVLEEATVWLPQNPKESPLSSIMVDDPDGNADEDGRVKQVSMLALLQRAFFSVVVRRGRKRGMGFTLAAQRIAEIDKRALQGSWMFLMRQTQPADFREYQKFGITPDEAIGLLDGEAFVFAPGKPREKHRLRLSHTPDTAGSTPGLAALRGKVSTEGAAPVTVKLLDTEKPSGTRLQQRHSQSINPALQMAYEAYQPRMNHHSLAAKMQITPEAAGHLLSQLRARGLIDVSLSPHSTAQNRAQNAAPSGESENGEMPVKPLQKPGETKVKDGESFTVDASDEIAVLNAAFQVQASGVSVTREAIKQKLAWNNKKHDIVKFVCDKHGIAMR